MKGTLINIDKEQNLIAEKQKECSIELLNLMTLGTSLPTCALGFSVDRFSNDS